MLFYMYEKKMQGIIPPNPITRYAYCRGCQKVTLLYEKIGEMTTSYYNIPVKRHGKEEHFFECSDCGKAYYMTYHAVLNPFIVGEEKKQAEMLGIDEKEIVMVKKMAELTYELAETNKKDKLSLVRKIIKFLLSPMARWELSFAKSYKGKEIQYIWIKKKKGSNELYAIYE